MDHAPQVLVVDDDVALAEVTVELLGFAGTPAIYRTTVIDATDAIMLHAGSIRAVLTDVHLATPMSGVELAVFLAEQWPQIGICVTSGIYHERPKRLPDKAHFLLKPWQTEDLLAAVSACAATAAKGGSASAANGQRAEKP